MSFRFGRGSIGHVIDGVCHHRDPVEGAFFVMTLLFISNRSPLRKLFEDNFTTLPWRLLYSNEEHQALESIESERPKIVLLDLIVSTDAPPAVLSPQDFLSSLSKKRLDVPLILLGSGEESIASQKQAKRAGAMAFFLLPNTSDHLIELICDLCPLKRPPSHSLFLLPGAGEPGATSSSNSATGLPTARSTLELEQKLLDHIRGDTADLSPALPAALEPEVPKASTEHEISEDDVLDVKNDPLPAPSLLPTAASFHDEEIYQMQRLDTELIRNAEKSQPEVHEAAPNLETKTPSGHHADDEANQNRPAPILESDEGSPDSQPATGDRTQELLNVIDSLEIRSPQSLVEDIMLDAALDAAEEDVLSLKTESSPDPKPIETPEAEKPDSGSWDKRQQEEALAHAAEKRIQLEMEEQERHEKAIRLEEEKARADLQDKLLKEEEHARKELHNKLQEEEGRARKELENQLLEADAKLKEEQENKLNTYISELRAQEEERLSAHKEKVLEKLKADLQAQGESKKQQEEKKFNEHRKHVLDSMDRELESEERAFKKRQQDAEEKFQSEFDKRIVEQEHEQKERAVRAQELLENQLKTMEEKAHSEMQTSFQEKLRREENQLESFINEKRTLFLQGIEAERQKTRERALREQEALSHRLAKEEKRARESLQQTIQQDWEQHEQLKRKLEEEQARIATLKNAQEKDRQVLLQTQQQLQEQKERHEKARLTLEDEKRQHSEERDRHVAHWTFESGLFDSGSRSAVEIGFSAQMDQNADSENEIDNMRSDKPWGGAWSLEAMERSLPPPAPPAKPVPLQPEKGAFALGELISLLLSAHQLQVTGSIDVHHTDGRLKTIYLEGGEPVGFSSKLKADRTEEFLFQRGLITHDKYLELQNGPALSARRLCVRLVDEAYLKPGELFSSIRMVLCNQILSCLDFNDGTFLYRQELSNFADRVRLSDPFGALLLQGVRLKFDENRIWSILGGPIGILSARNRDIGLPPFSPTEFKIVELLNRQRSLEDLVSSAGVEPVISLRVAYVLLAAGAVSLLARGLPQESQGQEQAETDIDLQRIQERLHMARNHNYFEFLGIDLDATPFEVRQAAARLRTTYDPDAYPDPIFSPVKAQLAEIQDVLSEAELVLGDRELREGYLRMARAAQESA
jgi:hypothetical protein